MDTRNRPSRLRFRVPGPRSYRLQAEEGRDLEFSGSDSTTVPTKEDTREGANLHRVVGEQHSGGPVSHVPVGTTERYTGLKEENFPVVKLTCLQVRLPEQNGTSGEIFGTEVYVTVIPHDS